MEDFHRLIALREAAAIEQHIWRLHLMIAQQERLIISRELAGIKCHEISWQIRSSHFSTLALYEALAGEMGIEIVGQQMSPS